MEKSREVSADSNLLTYTNENNAGTFPKIEWFAFTLGETGSMGAEGKYAM